MAGDWIKMRTELADDPAVIAVAEATGIDEFGVIGRLHRLWSWADKHTRDGNAPSVTYSWLDRYLSAPGFAKSLEEVGWLVSDGASVTIPNFDKHNSQSAKSRALTAKRVAESKKRKGNARSVTLALAREEKRRVSTSCKQEVGGPLPEVLENDLFRETLVAWKRYRGSKYKPKGEAAMIAHAANRATEYGLQAVVEAFKRAMANGWQGWDQDSSFAQRKPPPAPPKSTAQIAAEVDERLKRNGYLK